MELFILLTLVCSSCVIFYEDVTTRLISAWVIFFHGMCCVLYCIKQSGLETLLDNFLGSLLYGALLTSAIVLFYFVKERKFSNPIDTKVGTADIILFFTIGVTMMLQVQILFFTLAFFIAIIIGAFFIKDRTIPLGGILVIYHCIFLSVKDFLQAEEIVDRFLNQF